MNENIEKMKYKWKEIYSYVIPTVSTIFYIVCLILRYKFNVDVKILQESVKFEEMLKTVVTFMSIILSVFGFLIPSFLSGKGSNSLIKYFLKNADIKLFTVKLKSVVSFGLIDIFITCVLLIGDIMPESLVNIIVVVWIWILFFFMCSSYRFIGLIINLILCEKEDIVQKMSNKIPEDEEERIKSKIRKL